MSIKTLQTLELKGHTHHLLFENVVRRETVRTFNRYHDDRDEFPARVWSGDVTIANEWFGNKVTRPFHTDTFWQGHVRNLEFEDVLFLVVSRQNLFKMKVLDVVSKPRIVDHLARKAIEACVFNREQSIHFEPLRFQGHNNPPNVHYLELQPVFLQFESIVPTEEMVPIN